MTTNDVTRRPFVLRDLLRAFALWLDPRVPFQLKLIPVVAVLYLLLPVDLIPDLLVGLGQLDDLAILLLGLRLFVDHAQSRATAERADRDAVEGRYRVVE